MAVTYAPKHVPANTNTLVHTGRISVDQLLITSSATTATETVDFLDGTDASGELRCRIKVWASPASDVIRLPKPIVCLVGLFVVPWACDVNVWATGA